MKIVIWSSNMDTSAHAQRAVDNRAQTKDMAWVDDTTPDSL